VSKLKIDVLLLRYTPNNEVIDVMRKKFSMISALVAGMLLSVYQVNAFIDTALQMQLGNPSGATSDTNNHHNYLIERPVQALDYNDTKGHPNWVSWNLTYEDLGKATSSENFFTDNSLPPNFYRVKDKDYNGVNAINFNRGHLCPSADRTDTDPHNNMVFWMSNIIPQSAHNNNTLWKNLESYCRSLLAKNELLIITGPSGCGENTLPSGKVCIPSKLWKIVVVVPRGDGTALSRITTTTNRVIAVSIPNVTNGLSDAWHDYITSAYQIELDTGLKFFTALPEVIATAFRVKIDDFANINSATLVGWDTSGSTNFGLSPLSPSSKATGLTVVGLTRGLGVHTNGAAPKRAWGGSTFTNISSANAIASNQFITFSVAPKNGYTISFTKINKFDYRRSGTGPDKGLLQYQLDSDNFIDIANVFFTDDTPSGSSIAPIDLSGITDLQNVSYGTKVTFRIVVWGGKSSAGKWGIYDMAYSPAPDFALEGIVSKK
jgi:endonuclease G